VSDDGGRLRPARRSCFARRTSPLRLELFDTGCGQRQGLNVDTGGVHRRDSAIADVDEVGDEFCKPAASLLGAFLEPAVRAVEEGRRGEVFLEGDGAHCGFPSSRRSWRAEGLKHRQHENRRRRGKEFA
jgi:hypothetical protein